MVKERRLYDILGVQSDADDSVLKKSYRSLAKKYHPDKNPDGGDVFKEISMAYDILSNPEKRRVYDFRGEQGIKGGRPEQAKETSESEDEMSSEDEEGSFFTHHSQFFGQRRFFTFGHSFHSYFTFHAFGSSHGFHEESESESDEEVKAQQSDSDSDSEPDSGVHCDAKNRRPSETIDISSESEDESDPQVVEISESDSDSEADIVENKTFNQFRSSHSRGWGEQNDGKQEHESDESEEEIEERREYYANIKRKYSHTSVESDEESHLDLKRRQKYRKFNPEEHESDDSDESDESEDEIEERKGYYANIKRKFSHRSEESDEESHHEVGRKQKYRKFNPELGSNSEPEFGYHSGENSDEEETFETRYDSEDGSEEELENYREHGHTRFKSEDTVRDYGDFHHHNHHKSDNAPNSEEDSDLESE